MIVAAQERIDPAVVAAPAPLGDRPLRVAIVGTGFIATHHVQALRTLSGIEIVAACDVDANLARRFADRWDIPRACAGVDDLLREGPPDAAHVLVPPFAHSAVIEPLLEAGVHVLSEKPLAPDPHECRHLAALAERVGVRLGVNHNFVFHPVVARLRRDLHDRQLGSLRHVDSITHVPLRQLDAGEHDHWMFRHPGNILLEQGPHPLSQVLALLGPVREIDASVSGRRVLRTGRPFYSTWQLALVCDRGSATVYMSFGHETSLQSLVAVGQDGVARLDLENRTYVRRRRSRYLESVDAALTSLHEGLQVAAGGVRQLVAYSLGMVRGRRADSFFQSMTGSTGEYYRWLREGGDSVLDARAGVEVIDICHRAIAALPAADLGVAAPVVPTAASTIEASATGPRGSAAAAPALRTANAPSAAVDAAVIGGNGFIGRRVVAGLLREGRSVRVLGRRSDDASDPHRPDRRLETRRADVCDIESLRTAIRGARTVMHLASGAYATWEEYERSFIGGTRNVVEVCLEEGVERLVYASTIAAYYLGRRREVITEATPLDPRPERRASYSRAKIRCEQLLARAREERGLAVVVMRPGIVVGEGGIVKHSGVGLWANGIHCLTWGRGDLPLPFVLVDDVAEAFVLAAAAEGIDGRSYNLVGDVRPTAREYVELLAAAGRRRITAHPQAVPKLFAVDLMKWAIKAVARKPGNALPSYRDLASRTLAASFDNGAARRDLGWSPERDRARFIDAAITRVVEAGR